MLRLFSFLTLVVLAASLRAERERLVRWCAYLTGNFAVAEDLAQESLVRALRNVATLRGADEGLIRRACCAKVEGALVCSRRIDAQRYLVTGGDGVAAVLLDGE